MCDASVYPAMASCIQNACVEFPRSATKIVNEHGLEVHEFNRLLDKTRYNLFYRMRIMYRLKKINNAERRAKLKAN